VPEKSVTEAALFGRRVRALRKARKLGITQLAERAETGIKHLGRIERGEKQPSFELIIALAKGLNISPSALFDLDAEHCDPKVVKLQILQLLDKKDFGQLQKAARLLKALFDS
jgi:transcriptional regulator with XRE-family HTH domain